MTSEKKEIGSIPSTQKGMQNLGNTCFMNSLLQCLIWTPNFLRLLQEQTNQMTIQFKRLSEWRLKRWNLEKKSMVFKLKDLLEEAYGIRTSFFFSPDNNGLISSNKLKNFMVVVKNANNQFRGTNQQDSFELFNTILSGIEDEMKKLETVFKRHGNETELDHLMTICPVTRPFTGMYITEYKHQSCAHIEVVFQRFTSICVPVPESVNDVTDEFISKEEVHYKNKFLENHTNYENKGCKKENEQTSFESGSEAAECTVDSSLTKTENKSDILTDVEKGLQQMTRVENFTENELWCRVCTQKEKGVGICEKRILIMIPPVILVLQINRFKQQQHNGALDKIQNAVTYPEKLNLRKFCSDAIKVMDNTWHNPVYSLYGVVCHDGTLQGGHYYAYIKKDSRSSWIRKRARDEIDWKDPENFKETIVNYLYDIGGTQDIDQPSGENGNDNISNLHSWTFVSDKHVANVDDKESLNSRSAYILFYERVN